MGKLILHISGVNRTCTYSYNSKWELDRGSRKRRATEMQVQSDQQKLASNLIFIDISDYESPGVEHNMKKRVD